jgi:hypothetical protein
MYNHKKLSHMDESEKNGSCPRFYPRLMLTPLGNDCDLDLDEIWQILPVYPPRL